VDAVHDKSIWVVDEALAVKFDGVPGAVVSADEPASPPPPPQAERKTAAMTDRMNKIKNCFLFMVFISL
jgi:hypothetical protein